MARNQNQDSLCRRRHLARALAFLLFLTAGLASSTHAGSAHDITGTVLQPNGAPSASTEVQFVTGTAGHRTVTRAATNSAGKFVLTPKDSSLTGALIASTSGFTFRSAALEGVTPGARNLTLQLGTRRTLTVRVLGEEDRPLEGATVQFEWHLADARLQSWRTGTEASTGRAQWELPDIPFYVSIYHPEREVTRLGPLDPKEVGATLVFRPKPRALVHGLVTHEGKRIANAQISTRVVGESYWKPATTTNIRGRFEFALPKFGEYSIRVWDDDLGEGLIESLVLSPGEPAPELELKITRPPGAIRGRVIFPPGRQAHEIMLATHPPMGYMLVEPDGSFVLPGIPPGPLRVMIRAGYKSRYEKRQANPKNHGRWFSFTHGPSYGPDWLRVEPVFSTIVLPGEPTELELDLTTIPTCVLRGQFLIDGQPPRDVAENPDWPTSLGAVAVLTRTGSDQYVSRGRFDEAGTFELHAPTAGEYSLHFQVSAAHGESWRIATQVNLLPGVSVWNQDIPTGSLTILPHEAAERLVSFEGRLSHDRPDRTRITLLNRFLDLNGNPARYKKVPAGLVGLVHGYRDGSPRMSTTIKVGEASTVTWTKAR